ncbi:MAG: hypothetical protein ACLQVL_02620 [Terriglobia bacterium]
MAESRKESTAQALSVSRAHSAALAARMLNLEQECREIERSLDGYAGIFYQYVGAFPAETRQRIRGLLTEILQRIAQIRFDLDLPQRKIEIDKMLAAHLSQIWVTLHETHAHSLRGYGRVPEKLGAYLDPRVEEMLGLVANLRSAIESGKNPANVGQEAGK